MTIWKNYKLNFKLEHEEVGNMIPCNTSQKVLTFPIEMQTENEKMPLEANALF